MNLKLFGFYIGLILAMSAMDGRADDMLHLDGFTNISQTEIWNYDRIDIDNSLKLYNSGVVHSDIYVGDHRDLYLKNSGVIDGKIYLGTGARLFQIINSGDDITQLYSDKKYVIRVVDADEISWENLLAVAGNVNKIVLENSVVVVTDSQLTYDGVIESVGDVIFRVSPSVVESGIVTPDEVVGDGRVLVDVVNKDTLFVPSGGVSSGGVNIDLVRETDYYKVFHNELGLFLNNLRNQIPDDSLLRALDAAPDMDSLQRIMKKSVRLHPIGLMRPVRIMHRFMDLDMGMYPRADNASGNVSYIFSDDMNMVLAGLCGDLDFNHNFDFYASGYVGGFDVADNINDFSGALIGVNVGGMYDNGLIVGHINMGADMTSFDTGPLFSRAKEYNNPVGIGFSMAADIGIHTLGNTGLDVVPYIGVLADRVTVADVTDTQVNGNVGLGAFYRIDDWDIKYGYGIRGGVLTGNGVYANLVGEFALPDDNISGDLSVGILNDDIGTSYKISVMVRYLF